MARATDSSDADARAAEIHAQRLRAQLLSGPPATNPVAVAERLVAIQGQDMRGVRLAIRARSTGLNVADVNRCLTEDRSLVNTWLNRGTLHLVRSEDYAWLHALTAPQLLTGNVRRLSQEGVSPSAAEHGVAVIERSLSNEGPLTRYQLRDRIAAAGVRVEGQALIHLLFLASLRGLVVRGPMQGIHHAFVLVRDWLGQPPGVSRETALAELARRYLVGHGPATARDLARWAGVPLRDATAGLSAIAAELNQHDDGLVLIKGSGGALPLPPPRLLGPFEPVLLGWVSRVAIVGAHRELVTVNGIFRSFAMVRGKAVATWSMPGGKPQLRPFATLSPADARALDADAAELVRWMQS